MKNLKLVKGIMMAIIVGVAITGCGMNDVKKEEVKPTSEASVMPEESIIPEESIMPEETLIPEKTDILGELQNSKATPAEFIESAKENMNILEQENKSMSFVEATFAAQKDYIKKIAKEYEKANLDPSFSDLYASEVTSDLTSKIKDENIKKIVEESYANGLKLIKKEGYVFPIIDIKVYEDNFLKYVTKEQSKDFKKNVEEYNNSL